MNPRLAAVAPILLGALLCTRDGEPAYPSAFGFQAEKDLRQALPAATLVFVGSVAALQPGWFGATGAIAPSYERVTYRVKRVVRGSVRGDSIDISYLIFGSGLGERRGPGGYKLDPDYYRLGKSFVVLASISPHEPPERGFVNWSTWEASTENTRRIEALEKELPYRPGYMPGLP